MTISDKTKIEWKVVCLLLGAALSYGMLIQRVDTISAKQDQQGKDIAEIKAVITRSPIASIPYTPSP